MVPPWVPNPDSLPNGEENSDIDLEQDAQATDAEQTVAPTRRFAGARRSLGSFARTADTPYLRRSLGNYVRKGYGGAATATSRHGGTIRIASTLYEILSPPSNKRPIFITPLDRSLFEGKSAEEVINAIVETVCPIDGTLETEASRPSIKDALADLLDRFPDASLLEITDEQRIFTIERYVSMEVFRQFVLDIGTVIQEKASDPSTALARLREVQDYIRETVSASFRQLLQSAQRPSSSTISRIVQAALRDTFSIFEAYA